MAWRSVMLPYVPPGTELQLADADWEYGRGPIWLRVGRVREDISRFYGGQKLWIEGWRLDEATGLPVEGVQALVRVSALPAPSPERVMGRRHPGPQPR